MSEPQPDAPERRRLFVGVANSTSGEPGDKRLERAVSDVEELAACLGELGLEPICLLEPENHNVVRRELKSALPTDGLKVPGSGLVILWAGHGAPSTVGASLGLPTAGEAHDDADALTPPYLARVAAQSSASQVLLLVDTCFAGEQLLDALDVSARTALKQPDTEQRWAGIVASCQPFERAGDGVLVAKLLQLLREGPTDPHLRHRWSTYQSGLRGDDMLDALFAEWSEERQRPLRFGHGSASPLLMANPFFRPGAPERVVEHLLWSARGGSQAEEGNWFTGRERQLREVVAWMGAAQPGLCVVTGPAGSGKSAIAGRIVSLSVAAEREQIAAAGALPAADLDPGQDAVRAHIQVRGMDLAGCAKVLADALGMPASASAPTHNGVIAWVEALDDPPVIVVDGLDEAGDNAERIASELLARLVDHALVLVATREAAASEEGKTLIGLLGAPAREIDLGDDPDGTDDDVDEYVRARLAGTAAPAGGGEMDTAAVAQAVTELARETGGERREGAFLLARVLTSQLRERPLDTSAAGWEGGLATSVENALLGDLAAARPLVRDGESLPGAAEDLLTALAFSYGPGLPPDDVWPAVAVAISRSGATYGRLDAFWAVEQFRRYVTVSSLDGQAVYRLHQRLADVLRARAVDAGRDLAAIPGAVLAAYRRFLDGGQRAFEHRYLWYCAWLHAVDGEQPAIDILAALSEADAALVPDVARALTSLGNHYSEVGRRADAITPTQRAVDIYEALAADNPAFLNDLASALNNLGNRYSQVGRRADAITPTQRAVDIYEALAADNPAFLNDLASALNNLGNRYSQVGRRADAITPTQRAVDIYEALAADNPAFLNDLASALNNLGTRYSEVGRADDGPRRWSAALERFAADPAAGVLLRLLHARPAHEHAARIDDLLEAAVLDPRSDPALTGQLHMAARDVRQTDPERFDAAWQARAGAMPPWLTLDPGTLDVAVEWLNARPWAASRDVLAANAAALLTDDGVTALAEIALRYHGDPRVAQHQQILAAALADGIAETYAPLLVVDAVDAWLAVDDLAASQRFLAEHRDALTSDVATEVLAQRERPLHGALAALARAGQDERAYELMAAPAELPQALATARQSAPAAELFALALLGQVLAQDAAQAALAAVHAAIALVLADNTERACELADSARAAAPDAVAPLIDAVTDAIGHRGEHAAGLAAVIKRLIRREPADEADPQ